MSRRMNKSKGANIVADTTETFTNPISGLEETKVGNQFIVDDLQNNIALTRGDEPRFNDDETIDYMGWDSRSSQKVPGTYNLTGLVNQLSSILGGDDNVHYNKEEQVIHIKGRFNYKESINIHQPPHNIIRVAKNAVSIRGNAQSERQGLYGAY